MTTNDKPVCYEIRCLFSDGSMGLWASHETSESRDALAKRWDSQGVKYETRDLYDRPQPAAPQVPEGTMRQLLIACINDLDLIEGADKYDRGRLESVGLILRAITARPECPCGESTCVEPWEPGCGFGRSEEHVRVADPLVAQQVRQSMLDATPPAPEQPKPAGDVEADALAHVYAAGRLNGHLNTVEGTYVDAMYCDYAELFSEKAREVYDDARKRLAEQPAQGNGNG